MPFINQARRCGVALGLCLIASSPLQAQAQEAPLQWSAAIYGWFPAIGGTSSFPPPSGGSIDVSTKDVIDALKFAFMGNIGVKKGQWGLWTDVVYADFGASKGNFRDFTIGGRPLPGGVDANLSMDLKSWIWTAVGTYTVIDTPANTVDLLAGTRLLDLKQKLGWSFNGNLGPLPIDRTGNAEVSSNNWDGIIGVKGHSFLDSQRRWFVPYYLDIGTGQSKFTWQVNAGIGYRFDWGSLVANWRYIDYEMKSGKAIQSAYFNGPVIGAVFQW